MAQAANPHGGRFLGLELDEVLMAEGAQPQVLTAHTLEGERYLLARTHHESRGEGEWTGTWLCAMVTDRALDCVAAGRAEIRDAFAHSATGFVELVTVGDGRRGVVRETLRLCGELTDDDLPEPGIRLVPAARCA
jgi:hypothetical protein